jgi:hypothetical protein
MANPATPAPTAPMGDGQHRTAELKSLRERLRRHARSKRARLEDVAAELLAATALMGQAYTAFEH